MYFFTGRIDNTAVSTLLEILALAQQVARRPSRLSVSTLLEILGVSVSELVRLAVARLLRFNPS